MSSSMFITLRAPANWHSSFNVATSTLTVESRAINPRSCDALCNDVPRKGLGSATKGSCLFRRRLMKLIPHFLFYWGLSVSNFLLLPKPSFCLLEEHGTRTLRTFGCHDCQFPKLHRSSLLAETPFRSHISEMPTLCSVKPTDWGWRAESWTCHLTYMSHIK